MFSHKNFLCVDVDQRKIAVVCAQGRSQAKRLAVQQHGMEQPTCRAFENMRDGFCMVIKEKK